MSKDKDNILILVLVFGLN